MLKDSVPKRANHGAVIGPDSRLFLFGGVEDGEKKRSQAVYAINLPAFSQLREQTLEQTKVFVDRGLEQLFEEIRVLVPPSAGGGPAAQTGASAPSAAALPMVKAKLDALGDILRSHLSRLIEEKRMFEAESQARREALEGEIKHLEEEKRKMQVWLAENSRRMVLNVGGARFEARP